MAFQTQINTQPAPGLPGAFASLNPTATFPAGEGALVAAAGGCTIGAFGWVQADGRSVANAPANGATTAPDGFVHRDLTGQISSLFDESTQIIPQGFPVSLFTAGDFWASTTTAATPGQAVFASTTNGSLSTAAAGSTVSGAVQTRFYVASACAAGELVKTSSWSHAV
ncbi:structural cement protein Gp24 [Acetobacter orleanensis]|uniref:Uncharacterized protein n=1 Tax=Acetobacter orleanensis TaxID=104099 RepID=A0A4Y3TIN5_9PROT|nr:hypothetical protein [Acetobacter orleanensis]KXV63956.1 hypothetical protein AD949_06560 [Acetobacter orleanensis]PCD79730.1 hypothetical protein CO710_05880 [Acetobacter orleanensis]GAN69298.1 hypothetical protein Abol_030_063 [Acetobacter orleanensis JCM 7639]GBR28323.1 hypothetical protein AA0473_1712 [Acetobacter orleanensis NRIC 0473]GEB82176.1 hypothetical protein AOR01nite_06530 [Acetobacter orleanensis]